MSLAKTRVTKGSGSLSNSSRVFFKALPLVSGSQMRDRAANAKTMAKSPVGKNCSWKTVKEKLSGAKIDPMRENMELVPRPTFRTTVGKTSTVYLKF